jgi:hypothetical protein
VQRALVWKEGKMKKWVDQYTHEFKCEDIPSPMDDELLSILSWQKNVSEDHIYKSNEIRIVAKDDGAIFFSDENSDNFIYLYPEQVKHLMTFMKRVAKKVK